MLVVLVHESRRLGILGDTVTVVAGGSHVPGELQGFAHSQGTSVLLLLVCVGGQLADQVLAAVDRVSIVQDFTFQVGRANGQLASQSLEERGLAYKIVTIYKEAEL